MIDYVALIARKPGDTSFLALRDRMERALHGWSQPCCRPDVVVFTRSNSDSHFGAQVRRDGCLIGADLSDDSDQWGAFVNIAWSDDRHLVTVVRDPTGLVPCWRATVSGGEIVFSNLADVVDVADVPLRIDWEYIRYHLNAPSSRGARCGLVGVTELLPGWRLKVASGMADEDVWWNPHDFAASPFTTIEIAREAIRTAAARAVGAWGRRYDRVALTLSGGLDSAIVLGLLRKYAPNTAVVGVNFLVSHAEGDERPYAEAAARLHSIPLQIEVISPEGLRFGLSEGRGRLRPSNHVLPMGYREARERIATETAAEAVFTGTGGDHLFHHDVSAFSIADAMFERRPVSEIIAASHQFAGIARETLWSVLFKGLRARFAGAVLAADVVGRTNNFLADDARMDIDWSLAHPDLTAGRRQRLPGKLRQIISIDQLQNHYWRYGSAFRADEVHPLVSQPLLEASLRTPTYWFSHGGLRRGLARSAFADVLPEEVLTRRSKGSNTSQWIRVMTQNLPFLRALLLEGELARHGLVDQQRLEEALTPLSLAGKIDLGGLTACLNTELWLQQMLSDSSALGRRPAKAA